MPVPKPRKGERQNSLVSRFMSNPTMKTEFKDHKQRTAVALSTWREAQKKEK